MIHSHAAGERLLKFITGAALLCASWLVVPQVVLAEPQITQYYVSSAGADTSGCGTLGNPCKTISYLLPSVSAGDQISVTNAITDNFTLEINVAIAGAPGASIDGSGARIITVDADVSASLSNLTLQHGGGSQDGGLIHNAGALAINNAILTGGVLNGRNGGAIYNTGIVTITGSVITGNEAYQGYGGGIENQGVVFISNSTISNNRADSGGGIDNFASGKVHAQRAVVMGNTAASGAGIYNDLGPLTRVWLTDTAVVSNSASNEAGGIFNGGHLSLVNVTVGNNYLSNGEGVAIDHRSGWLSMLNVTVAANTVANVDDSSAVNFAGAGTIQNSVIANGGLSNCSGTLGSNGYNLSSDNTCSFLDQATDLEGVEAQLGGLQYSAIGYDTYTSMPLRGSPLVNRIPVAMCGLAGDQRGVSRPQGNDCDVGAHEVVPADLSLAATASPASLPAGTPLTVTLNVTNTGPTIATGVVVTSALPAGVGLQDCTGITGTIPCVASGSQMTATLGTLGVGGNVSISVRLIPQQSGELAMDFVSASDAWDPQTANNSATTSASVMKSADLSVSLQGAPVVQPNAIFTLTAEVQNRGDYPADSAAFTITLPADVSYISAIGPSWDCELDSSTVTCDAQTSLPAGAVSQVVITLRGKEVPAQLHFVINAASITFDPDITNNITAMTMTVRSGSTIALPIVLR